MSQKIIMFSEIKNPNQKIIILRCRAFFKGSSFFTNSTILFFWISFNRS